MHTPDKNILRIIDANINRSREGLRVCEDIVRFILADRVLTTDLKALRHRFYRIIESSGIKPFSLYIARDSKHDEGKAFSVLENKRDWQSIFFANLQRAKESLRALEEFFKLSNEDSARSFKRLRFNLYEFEKKAFKRAKALSDYRYLSRKNYGFL